MQAGDVLLIEAGPTFLAHHWKDRAFTLVSDTGSSLPRTDRPWLSLVVLALIPGLFLSGVAPVLVAAVAAASLLILSRSLTVEEARRSIKWDVIVTTAATFGISQALENTRLSRDIGHGMGEEPHEGFDCGARELRARDETLP